MIDRPVNQVFAFFTNPRNDLKWRPHVKQIDPQGPAGLGSTIHQVVQGPGGRGIPADIEVTGFESPSRYAFKVTAGPVRPIGEFQFAPAGSGTEVIFSLHADLGGIKKLVMSRPVQNSMDAEMAALDKAKSCWRPPERPPAMSRPAGRSLRGRADPPFFSPLAALTAG